MKRKNHLITRCLLFCLLALSIGDVFGGEKFTMDDVGSIEVELNHTRHEMTLYFLPSQKNRNVEYRVSSYVKVHRERESEPVRIDMKENPQRRKGRRVFKIKDKLIKPYQDYDISISVINMGSLKSVSYWFQLEERFYSHVGLKEMILQGNTGQIEKILAKRPELLRYRDENGDTILHWSSVGNSAANGFLIELGAEINAQNKSGETPLHKLVQSKSYYTVKQMIKWGADTTIKDNRNMTAMNYAEQYNDKHLVEVLSGQ